MQATADNTAKAPSAREGIIEQIIKRYIDDSRVVFVFPTEIAAGMWQERALDWRAVLPDERFLPWDRFKGIHAAKAEDGKAEIQERVRELYAEELGKRNAETAKNGKPLLRSAIPLEFAENAQLFSPWIASVLPHLALWDERRGQAGAAARFADAEDKDIEFILEDYKAFLERSKLFEPSWCRRFEGEGKKHIIFFYEAIEGFSAYSHALKAEYFSGEPNELPDAGALADFTAVSAPAFKGEAAPFKLHADFRKEFRSVALKIEKLLMEGESADTIAVSLSDAEESEPYLSRELETRGIPYRLRFGRTLAESSAGRIFPLIQQCSSEDFSFNSVKKLVSLKSITWRKPKMPLSLIRFGIKNRCLCSWREDGEDVDIWKSAFSIAKSNALNPSMEEWLKNLEAWYEKLKKCVRALASANSFADVRKAWFAFRNNMLDAEKMGFFDNDSEAGKTKENLEIGRCIAELDELVDIEKAFPELTPRNPFSFFVARLKRARYVPQSKAGGVSVFKLKDAAAAPFKFHFITGATQEDATALHSELRFLRKDKRDVLDKDEDASQHIFSSYINGAGSGGRVFFSASGRGVGGYKTVHGEFAAREGGELRGDEAEELLPDPLEMDELQKRPPRIYPVQKKGFEAYSILNGDKAARFSFLKRGFAGNASEEALLHIKKTFAEKQKDSGGATRVSATDLNAFAECPAKWLMEKAFKLKELEFSPELDIVDAGTKGSIFHQVAENLYNLIKAQEEDGAFSSENADVYLKEADKIISEKIAEDLDAAIIKSPLGALACPALAAKLKKWVEALISEDSKHLDGFVPVMTEYKACFCEDGIEYTGRIDRISEKILEDTGNKLTVIVDYKTGSSYPNVKDYKPNDDDKIRDFQMPFYVFLCERELKKDVTQAWFFSATKPAYIRILDTEASKGASFKSAGEFAPAIEAMKKEARAFAQAISTANFSAKDVYSSTCYACDYRTVCRHAYSVAQD